MKVDFRTPWLAALAVLLVVLALVAGEPAASASGSRTRSCELDGAWINTARGTSNTFSVQGALTRRSEGSDQFIGTFQDGDTRGDVTGQGQNGRWNFYFAFVEGRDVSGLAKLVHATEQATEANNQFALEGTYETQHDRVDINRSGDFTLSGTCRRN